MTSNPYLSRIKEKGMSLFHARNYLDQFEINDKDVAEAFLYVQLEMDTCRTSKQLYDKYTTVIYVGEQNQKVLKQMGTEIPNHDKSLENNRRTLQRINDAISLAGEIEIK